MAFLGKFKIFFGVEFREVETDFFVNLVKINSSLLNVDGNLIISRFPVEYIKKHIFLNNLLSKAPEEEANFEEGAIFHQKHSHRYQSNIFPSK